MQHIYFCFSTLSSCFKMAESNLISGKSPTLTLSNVKLYSEQEWETFKQEYQKNGYKFSIFKSRSIKSASTTLTRNLNQALGRYYIEWYCQQSGIFKSRGNGERSVRTMKKNCPAFIKLNVDNTGQFLTITDSCEMHNHAAHERSIQKLLSMKDNDMINEPQNVASGMNRPNKSQPIDEPLDLTLSNNIIFDDFVPIISESGLSSGTKHQFLSDAIGHQPSASPRPRVMVYEYPGPQQIAPSPMLNKSKQRLPATKISKATVAPQSQEFFQAMDNHEVEKIIMPTQIKSRGRPKGRKNTASGVHILKGPARFENKSKTEKKRLMMSWLMPEKYVKPSLMGEYDIMKEDLEHLLVEGLSDAFIDVAVDMELIKEHFERDAWEYLMTLISEKKEKNIISCCSCNKALGEQKRVCNGCKLGYHISCIEKKMWKNGFCYNCQKY